MLGLAPAALAAGVFVLWSGGPTLAADGPQHGALLGAAELPQTVFRAAVEGADASALAGAVVLLDGTEVDGAKVAPGEVTWSPVGVPDGEHRLEVRVDRGLFRRDRSVAWTFTVDTTPPQLALDIPTEKIPHDEPVTITGAVEQGAEVEVAGAEASVEGEQVSISFTAPPLTGFDVVARDEAGNEAVTEVALPVEPPQIRAVHMTALAWKADSLREPVLKMIDEGRINAVELDIKDEAGIIGWDTKNPLAHEIGAVEPAFNIREAVEQLHAKGVRVVGRLVVFRDPVLAAYAWDNGRREQVIQTPDGGFYGKYGGFTNFADETVRQYNIDIAVEAAQAGVDEILYDYIRRPDGEISGMVFPGLEGTPEESIVGFLRDSRARLREIGAVQGASVFGIAATRPTEIAQDIPRMAEYVDYIAPMVYPSHWGPGEYGVRNPNAQPYDIVYESMKDFQEAVAHTDARIVPWLQDFTLGVTYGPAEVKAQINAARDAGIDEWIMWDPKCTYTLGAYERR